MNRTEYAIINGEKIVSRVIDEKEVQLTDETFARLTANQTIRMRDIVELAGIGKLSLAASSTWNYWTVPLREIRLNAPFSMHTDGYLYPNFTSQADPRMEIAFKPSFDGMKVVLLILTSYHQNLWEAGQPCWQFHNMYLVARDREGRNYKMPLPNVYEDCRVCHGGGNKIDPAPTSIHIVNQAVNVFNAAPWNADLWDGQKDQCKAMFRFKPKGKGFEQLNPVSIWTSHCNKVATAHLSQIIA